MSEFTIVTYTTTNTQELINELASKGYDDEAQAVAYKYFGHTKEMYHEYSPEEVEDIVNAFQSFCNKWSLKMNGTLLSHDKPVYREEEM